jgi:hypothetical protein
LDVKYLVGGGFERNVDPCIVSPFETLERGGRKRRGRDFLFEREEDLKKKQEEEEELGKSNRNNNRNDDESDIGDAEDRDRGVSAAAAAKEGSSSRQSITTYSTPQKKQNKAASKPKKVTPIPKMVKIGSNTIDSISPMTEDRPTAPSTTTAASQNNKGKNYSAVMPPPPASQTQPPSSPSGVARRGLFFDVDLDNDRKEQTATANKKKMMKEKSALPKRGDGEENNFNSTIMTDRKPAAKPRSQLATKTGTEQVVGGAGRLRVKSNIGSSIMGLSKKTSKPSFSRTTSAYAAALTSNNNDMKSNTGPGSCSKAAASAAAPATTTTPSFNRKPLLDVYREEVKKAREFMDEMVGPSNANDDDTRVGGYSETTGNNQNKRFIRTTPYV